MIQSLNISNFQSHKKSEFDFDPGVNVIVGPSDSGKTAIIRALRWLIWNRPVGDEFRSTWGGDTRVEIWIDGFGTRREKGERNAYITGIEEHPDSKPNIFEAFGTDIPEGIKEFLNMDDTNLQQQLDSHFLISNSPGEVAAYFNKIAHLDQIDSGLKYLNSQIRQLDNKRGFIVEQQAEVAESLKRYEYLNIAEEELGSIERINHFNEQSILAFNRLRYLIESLGDIEKEEKVIKSTTSFEKEVDQIQRVITERDRLDEEHTDLLEMINYIEEVDSEIKTINKLVLLDPEVDLLLDKIETVNKQYNSLQDLEDLLQQHSFARDEVVNLAFEINRKEKELIKNTPDVCPFCDQPIKK